MLSMWNRGILLSGMLMYSLAVFPQVEPAPDTGYINTHYTAMNKLFAEMPPLKKAVVFVGNSITEAGKWNDLLPGHKVLNRGISGDITYGVMARLPEILKNKPRKIFLMIGINDLKRGIPVETIENNYRKMVEMIREQSPGTKIYLQSVLPVNYDMLIESFRTIKNEDVAKLNRTLRSMADNKKIFYVDLHEVFADEKGELKKEESPDGIHIKIQSYYLWAEYLIKNKYL